MKVLLDEDLPHDLRLHIENHDVQTAVYAGFAGHKNGRLMESLATGGFQVFLEQYQCHCAKVEIGECRFS